MKSNEYLKYSYVISLIIIIFSLIFFKDVSKLILVPIMLIACCMFFFSFFSYLNRKLDIMIFFVLATECFYFPLGPIKATDLFVAFILLLIIKNTIYKSIETENIYKFTIILLIILSFFSSLNAMWDFKQSYFESISPFRNLLILLAFLPIADWYEKGYKVEKYLINISFVALIIFFIQYLLYNHVQFLEIPYVSQRYGSYRLHFQTLTPVFGAMIAFNYFMNNKTSKYKWFALSVYFIGLLFTILVNQTRSYMFGLLLAAIIILIFTNRDFIYKYKIIMLGTTFLLVLVYFTPVSELFSLAFNDIKQSSGTLETRYESRDYYLSLAKNHPLIGQGLINLKNDSEWKLPGYSEGYFWVDIGIFGVFYLHGVIGVFWYFSIILLIVKKAKKIIGHKKVYLLSYALFCLITLTTVGPVYFYLFPTAFCLATLQFIDRGMFYKNESIGVKINE